MDMKRKKAGIITFHEAVNYGAVLQAYALCRALAPHGEAVIYPHRNEHIHRLYHPSPFLASSLSGMAGKALYFPHHFKKYRAFSSFARRHLPLGEAKPETYDLFITGSDQVWNHAATRFDKAYFLDFVADPARKNAYAASFGFETLPDNLRDSYRALLSDFNRMSVREESGRAIIRDLLDREAQVVLDPTLLLTREMWQAAFPGKPLKKPLILVYAFELTDSLCEAVNLACARLDAPATVLMPMRSLTRRRSGLKRAVYRAALSPEEWVNHFLQADVVLTNSFHGLAFSLNFNKPFILELLKPPAKVNTRLLHLLETVGLENRVLDHNAADLLDTPIDYAPVNHVLAAQRESSLGFLTSLLSPPA